VRLYTRIRISQVCGFGPFIFLRWMVIGAGLTYALFRALFWLGT